MYRLKILFLECLLTLRPIKCSAILLAFISAHPIGIIFLSRHVCFNFLNHINDL
jgi:hypothetical protein